MTEAEVLNALEQARNDKDTKHHASAKSLSELLIKNENAALRKILCTPFYFTIALEVFYKRIPEEINLPNDEEKLKIYLIEKYVARKLDKIPNPYNFGETKTKKWLKWLAKLMEDYDIVTFELADLQPVDLGNKLLFNLVGSIFISSISLFIYTNFCISLFVFVAAYLYLSVSDLAIFKDLSGNNIVRYDLFKLFKPFVLIFIVLQTLFLLVWLQSRTLKDLAAILLLSVVVTFYFWMIILIFRIGKYKRHDNFAYIRKNYQRISAQSLINTIWFILLSILLFAINQSEGLTLLHIVVLPLSIRFLLSISLLWHLILRFCLYLEEFMPLKYATFLDYAAELRILEKDGGHWRFRHQNLQEYFANLDNQAALPRN